jgi:hypothetical protein
MTQVCGAAAPNQCGAGPCTPKTCASLGLDCGDASDGCGGMLHCGTCAPPQTCGAGGIANHCGCMPKTCDQLGAQCGTIADGCGAMIDCGMCPDNKGCGVKQPNHCDKPGGG